MKKEKDYRAERIAGVKEVFRALSAWGCKFEETILYKTYCENRKQQSNT